jgi:hypothetical protein
MTEPQELPNLHDAVLERIELNWEAGEITIDLTRVPGGPLRLTGSGVLAFSVSRRQEWGPSIYINDAYLGRIGEDQIVLELEIQSGDTLSLTAARVVATT